MAIYQLGVQRKEGNKHSAYSWQGFLKKRDFSDFGNNFEIEFLSWMLDVWLYTLRDKKCLNKHVTGGPAMFLMYQDRLSCFRSNIY